MVTAVAGMVDPVRVTEITAAVSRTRASVLPIIMILMRDSWLLSLQKENRFAWETLVRLDMTYVSL